MCYRCVLGAHLVLRDTIRLDETNTTAVSAKYSRIAVFCTVPCWRGVHAQNIVLFLYTMVYLAVAMYALKC